jgi:N-acetylmuramoyl-L-alanine amidase
MDFDLKQAAQNWVVVQSSNSDSMRWRLSLICPDLHSGGLYSEINEITIRIDYVDKRAGFMQVMTNIVFIRIFGVDCVLNKLRTSGITVLLAISAIALIATYTRMPDRPSTAQNSQEPPPPITMPSAVPVTGSEVAKQSRGLISLDPGHQRKGNNQQEPVAPDSKEKKPKVSGGTTGVSTGKPEYVLNLEVAVLLKQALVKRGFEVIMTREDHDVDISNIERAEMANEANAQLAVRIHADGDASSKTKGFSILYPDAGVRSTQSIQPSSRKAAEAIFEAVKKGTDASSRGMIARSDLSGFNWSKVPVVLIEMGFMTNPSEDEQMSDPEYQQRMAEAIAEGVDMYMTNKED